MRDAKYAGGSNTLLDLTGVHWKKIHRSLGSEIYLYGHSWINLGIMKSRFLSNLYF